MRIFMTGGTGFLGSNIIKVAVEEHAADLMTTVHSWQPEGPTPFAHRRLDMTDVDQLYALALEHRPDVIIHCAILNDFERMYHNRPLAWKSYVDSTRALCDAANHLDARLILISTDWVFDGTQSRASESTPPNPINLYGVLKVVGETVVAERAKNGAVARVGGVSGTHWLRADDGQAQNAGFGYFAAAVVWSLSADQEFVVWEGDINMVATPGLASENARMILQIARQEEQGVFHCCGGEAIGRFELAELICDVFELDRSLLRRGPTPASDPTRRGVYAVPRDTSLDASFTAETIGYSLPSVRELMQRYRIEMSTNQLS